MLTRRNRALVKPNIAKASKVARPLSEKTTPTTSNDTETADVSAVIDSVESSDHQQTIEPQKESTLETFTSIEENSPPVVNDEPPAPVHNDTFDEEHNIDPLAPEKRIAHVPVDHSRLLSPKSYDRYTTDYYEPPLPRPRKKFAADEQLDPKKMRMMDMIYWNPKKEKSMTRRNIETESVVREEKPSVIDKISINTSKTVAPQVKIGPDGRLVIDEKSLVVAETVNDESVWETIDEDRVSRKVTSLSFRNRTWRKGTCWTEKETELFYEILRCTGPDFGLMHEFFPTRARNELKTKFNREERNNWGKLKEVPYFVFTLHCANGHAQP
ncbi:Myb-like DNA-binding domain protein [Cooperia oncophora]